MKSNETIKNVFCKSCNDYVEYKDKDCSFREYSTYSVKLLPCPKCGKMIVVRTIEDKALYVNTDARYYFSR